VSDSSGMIFVSIAQH